MARAQQQMGQSSTGSPPLKEGGLLGAVAYVVGLALTFVLVQVDSDLEDSLLTQTLESIGVGTIDITQWVYASAHLIVDMKSEVSGGGQSQTNTESLFSEASTSLPEPVYYAVPVVVLVGAGFLVVQQANVQSSEDAMKGGAALAAGYLPLALVTTFLFRASDSQGGVSFTFGPDLIMVGVTGVAFPLVLGAAGAYLGFSQSGAGSGGHQQQPRGGQQGYQQGGQGYQQGGQQGGQRQQGGQQGRQRQQGGQQGGRQQRDDQRGGR